MRRREKNWKAEQRLHIWVNSGKPLKSFLFKAVRTHRISYYAFAYKAGRKLGLCVLILLKAKLSLHLITPATAITYPEILRILLRYLIALYSFRIYFIKSHVSL